MHLWLLGLPQHPSPPQHPPQHLHQVPAAWMTMSGTRGQKLMLMSHLQQRRSMFELLRNRYISKIKNIKIILECLGFAHPGMNTTSASTQFQLTFQSHSKKDGMLLFC